MQSKSKAMLVLSLGLLLEAFLTAQVNSGTILGTVTDPTGAMVAGTRVTALNELTGFSRVATTGAEGSYLLPLLPVSDLFKNFRLRESLQLQFRSELFNAFNRVNLNNPNTLITSPIFGRISDAGNARIVQFGVKVNW